jgi:hypothetical protein
MLRLWQRGMLAVAALAIGVVAAEPYARLAAPYYTFVARVLAHGHAWEILNTTIDHEEANHRTVLRLNANVRRFSTDPTPAAVVNSGLHVGALTQNAVIFWALLLLWPFRFTGSRWRALLIGVPVFLGLEAATTVCQLLAPLADASAVLAGDPDPLTAWECWSRFLEGGGRYVLAFAAALLTLAVATARVRLPGAARDPAYRVPIP